MKKRAGEKLNRAGESKGVPERFTIHTGFQSAEERSGKPESKSAVKNAVCSAIVAEETRIASKPGKYGLIAQPVRAHA